MATRVQITNRMKGPRGFNVAGRTDQTVIPVDGTETILVTEGELKNIRRMAENGEIELVEKGEVDENAAAAAPGAATTTLVEGEVVGAGAGGEGAGEITGKTGDGTGEGEGGDGKKEAIDFDALDDDQLRLYIETESGKAPHPNTGREGLLKRARNLAEPD